MKPQAQIAPGGVYPGHDPLPPVVIKIGGGSGPPNGVPVTIDCGESETMCWTDDTGRTWNEAWSTYNCQIQGFSLQDGRDSDPVLFTLHPGADALSTLTLYFKESDEDAFKVSEVQDKDGSIYLAAKSSRLFEVTKHEEEDRWTASVATFWSALVKVEFRQRKIGADDDFMRYEYVVNSDYVELHLDFPLT